MVGWAMANCPENLPWQRVVMADGSVAGGTWAEIRRVLLKDEGVSFLPNGRVDMKKCAWDGIPKSG
jgi:methylated-DNA-protein-cysteine methyltransferase-like protein